MKKRILDIGCWNGERVLKLRNTYNEAYGVDITNKNFAFNDNEWLKVFDITSELPKTKPFDKKFDVIYCTEVIEHLNDDEAALQNIRKLLKENGTLYLSTPRSIPLFEFYDPAWIKWKLGIGGRHYHYSMSELFSKLVSNGFHDIKFTFTGSWNWLFLRWFNGIFRTKILTKKKEGYFDWEIVAQ
jgi:2-polyprenyl-3-methyl-5-hydroxy-6-metoxy-1,4-benzoquinol methylase